MRNRILKIQLPDEFLELCDYDLVSPEKVLRDFIADLCDLSESHCTAGAQSYVTNGAADRDRARAYYERIHAWHAEWLRNNVPHLVERMRTRQKEN
jgi:hypothetical protein